MSSQLILVNRERDSGLVSTEFAQRPLDEMTARSQTLIDASGGPMKGLVLDFIIV